MGGRVLRSPVVVGREHELDRLHRAVSETTGCLVFVGEAGVGKTRLLTTIAGRAPGLAVLTGRAPATAPVAFGTLAQALRSRLRTHPVDPALMAPFGPGLQLVLPEWPVEPGGDRGLSPPQLRLLALEGVVRLLARVRPALLILDDLHGADPDSIEAFRYLAAAGLERLVIVVGMRPDESVLADEVVRALDRDGVAEMWRLAPLAAPDVTALLTALLDAEPPAELTSDVLARTDGVPLLVEEVVDAHLRAGSVLRGEQVALWRGGARSVPAAVSGMVAARLHHLDPAAEQVLLAGAVLGDFDTDLLCGVTGASREAVSESVAGGVRSGLLEATTSTVDFRHAVLREALLDLAVPPARTALHRRAAEVLAGSQEFLERRAHHLAAVGEHDDAAGLLTEAAVLDLQRHAVLSAEHRARAALDAARSAATRDNAADLLAEVLAAQGRWGEALELDRAAEPTGPRLRRMAECALETCHLDVATEVVEKSAGDPSAWVHVVASRLAMLRGDPTAALAAADRALAAAGDDQQAYCDALNAQGRALDLAGRRDDAEAAYLRQADHAAATGRTASRLRALVCLGELELLAGRPPVRSWQARHLAVEAGALLEQAWAELNLSWILTFQGDLSGAARIAAEAAERCRRQHLDVEPYLLLAQGFSTSFFAPDAAGPLFDEADARSPDGAVWSVMANCLRGDVALYSGRYRDAVHHYEVVLPQIAANPGITAADSPYWIVFALIGDDRREEARQAIERFQSIREIDWRIDLKTVLATAAAVLDGSAEGVDAALAATRTRPIEHGMIRVLAAEMLGGAAPHRWLRDAHDVFENAGATAISARIRGLMRRFGVPVPRQRRADVPADLAAHGVTAREAEVLTLLGDGLSNADIAARLHLSVRTVETHVSSLLGKLQATSRSQLIARRNPQAGTGSAVPPR